MGRILRKKRVGNKDNENLFVKKSVLLDQKTLNLASNTTPDSSCKSKRRTVLMDKTNVVKQKDSVMEKIDASAKKVKELKKSSQKQKGTEENPGKIILRRKSSKENDKELKKSPHTETESCPLGDKTNAPAPKKRPLHEVNNSKISEDVDVKAQDSKKAPDKVPISPDEDNQPSSVDSECPMRKRPPRNAAKFKDGWISALRSSRTSKESDKDWKKPSPSNKSKPVIPLCCDETSPPKEDTRVCRAEKDTKPGKGSAGIKPEESPPSTASNAVRRGVQQDLHSKQPKSERTSMERGSNAQASHDEEVIPQKLASKTTPLRKLPPRNAAKFEKGWISSFRRSQNSHENDSDLQTSTQKTKPSGERTSSAEGASETSCDEDARHGKENKTLCNLRSMKKAERMPMKSRESDENKNLVPELQKASEPPFSHAKNLLGSSVQIETGMGKDLESPPKPGKTLTAESKTRGLRNFESRIAAKLGIDMSVSSAGPISKDRKKSPKKSPRAKEASSRRLRKRVAQQIKTYAEAEGSEDETFDKKPSSLGSAGSSVKPLTAPHNAQRTELIGAIGEDVTSPGVDHEEQGFQPSSCGNSTSHEPKPGCSRDPEFTTPLRSISSSNTAEATKKSPLVAPSSSLFSIFKKPETPRRNSLENKIFVSGAKPCPPAEEDTNKKQLPIYRNPNMTPLKRTTALPQEKKEELYDFEVDEDEPKPRKRHKPIMKIQRVRAHKRKKPKVYEADPETELRVLKNLDLSPSVFDEFRSAKKKKVENAAGVIAAQPSSPHPAEAAKIPDHPPDAEAADYLFSDIGPMSSPCRDYGQSTPMRTDAPSMFLDESRDKFGRLSAKVYSPVKSKDSPIPVLMAEYNNDPVRRNNSSRRSVASNASYVSGMSGNSIYQNDLDVSVSTPVKFNTNDSTTYKRQSRKPLELNVSNCFGFDEPEMMEEPLISPIKSTIHVPVNSAPAKPAPILKSKPPVMLPPPATPAVNVDQVIKQLRFEVGENSSANNSLNVSVYDDSEITLKNKSPIKRYLQPQHDHKHKANEAADESTLDDGNNSLSPIPVAPKVPRLSYERLNKLRKKKFVEPVYKEASESESAEGSDESDEEREPEPAEHIFEPTKSKYPAKKRAPKKKEKGMTKKEEEELEKWAQMFNSQCNQIDGFGLVVE